MVHVKGVGHGGGLVLDGEQGGTGSVGGQCEGVAQWGEAAGVHWDGVEEDQDGEGQGGHGDGVGGGGGTGC